MKNKINLSFEKWFEKNKAMLCAIPAPYNAYKTVWEALLKIINTGTPQGEEIKNCPFCDSVSVKAKSKHGSIHYGVQCQNYEACGARVFGFIKETDAIEAWNRRIESQ